MKKRGHLKSRAGFTMIEIMVVVVIVGLLMGLVGPRVFEQFRMARRKTTKAQIENFVQALELYRLHSGFYPTTQQGLQALVQKPTTSPTPKKYPEGGYISSNKVPDDPWGNPYIYRCPGERGEIDIISTAEDGEEGGEGYNADITNHDEE